MADDLDRLLADYDPMPDWPNCETFDCGNKVCTWGHQTKCFPCAVQEVGYDEMVRRFDATHDHKFGEDPDD